MSDLHFDRALRGAARRGRPEGVCPDAAALASYVDRSLSPAEHAALEAHVASCPACIEHLALLAAVDAPEAPADAVGRVVIRASLRQLALAGAGGHRRAGGRRLDASARIARRCGSRCRQEKAAEAPEPVASSPSSVARLREKIPQTSPPNSSSGRMRARGSMQPASWKRRDRKRRKAYRLQSAQVDAFKQKERDEEAANERKNRAVAASPCCSSRSRHRPAATGRRRGEAGCRSRGLNRGRLRMPRPSQRRKTRRRRGWRRRWPCRRPRASREWAAVRSRCARPWSRRRSRSRLQASACASSAAASNDPAMAAQRGRRSEPASRRAC